MPRDWTRNEENLQQQTPTQNDMNTWEHFCWLRRFSQVLSLQNINYFWPKASVFHQKYLKLKRKQCNSSYWSKTIIVLWRSNTWILSYAIPKNNFYFPMIKWQRDRRINWTENSIHQMNFEHMLNCSDKMNAVNENSKQNDMHTHIHSMQYTYILDGSNWNAFK